MIRVVCECGRAFKADDRHAGKRTKCPVCGAGLTIGNTPVSTSSAGDDQEVPSWWYPPEVSSPSKPPQTTKPPAKISETRTTAILPPGKIRRLAVPAPVDRPRLPG
jgi:hypothetical protein